MKKRGNPLWGKQLESAQVIGPTEFEKLVKKLHLAPEQWPRSKKLAEWCRVNRNHRYIPESLLDAFGIHMDVTF